MKEISDKVNKLKQLESIKQVKQIQKEQLAKQYDEMVANAKPKEEEEKENIKPKEEEIAVIKKDEIKPIKKKRIFKKIVYQEASEHHQVIQKAPMKLKL